MAKIEVKIKILEGTGGQMDRFECSGVPNNVSLPITWGNTSRRGDFPGIRAGGHRISLPGKFIDPDRKYSGWVMESTDAQGEGELYIEIEDYSLSGYGIEAITIYGDKESGQWATEAVVGEIWNNPSTITSDDHIWTISFAGMFTWKQSIRITKWNRPNYNMVIKHIEMFPEYMVMDNAWIKEVSSLSQSSTNDGEPRYGLLPNRGSLSIVDRDVEFRDYARQGMLDKETIDIKLLLNDKQVQEHRVVESPYFSKEFNVNFTLTDKTKILDDDSSSTMVIEPYEVMSAYELLMSFWWLEWDLSTKIVTRIGELTVEQYLKKIAICGGENGITYRPNSLREGINKICEIAQLSAYLDENGILKFANARPLLDNSITVIPLRLQMSQLEYSLIKTNQYTEVEFA